MVSDVLSEPGLVETRDAWMTELSELFNGAPRRRVFHLDGVYGWGTCDPYSEPERWTAEALASLAEWAEALRDPHAFRPLCVEFGPFGVHFVDKIFGAEVYFESDQWYSRYLDTPIGSLKPPNLDNDPTFSLARRVAEAFFASGATVPFLGLPTIASALNVAVNLYGQEFLVTACIEPDAAMRDLSTINDALIAMHRWYLDRFPAERIQPVISGHRTQPPGYGQICGCTTQLLSPGMYAELVAPLDSELLSVYPNGGMIHLCGSHTQHLPTWKGMENLRAVQLNDRAAEDLEAYFTVLREDQIIYLNPCEGMTVGRALEITGGHRLVVVSGSNGDIPLSRGLWV